jgi:peptide/nickel transport system ATP-binding protein
MNHDRNRAPVLEVLGLSVRLPAGADRPLAVDAVSLTVWPGQTLCIVGESGSGKSMVANAVMGLLPLPHVAPVAGQILFEGTDLLQLNDAQLRELRGRRIGMISQEPMTALNPVMRIGEQLAEVIDAHQTLARAEKRRRILLALADVGLPEPELLIDSFPFRLSGGQRQRVLIACALLLEPALLIADEPTTALDVTTQAQILALIRELQRKRGTAVLFITHDFGVVSQIADQVAVMQTGSLVEAGAAQEILRNPQHAYTRKLIAAIAQEQPRHVARSALAQPVLQVHELCKTYHTRGGFFKKTRHVQAAKNISFDLYQGQTLGLVGESGSGKSSVGRCLVGLAPFDSGTIRFNGHTVAANEGLRRAVGGKIQMVFQDPYSSLNPRHRVGATIAAGPIAQGVKRQVALEQALELLRLVGLSADAAHRYPHEFSGGQRQRIGIARALALQPDLLVADEPVSALDVSVQAQVLELFGTVRQQFKLAMVFITHDLRVAGLMCDHIAVMQRGEIVEYGETRQVLTAPQHEYTRKLIEAVPSLTPVNSDAQLAS